MEQSKKKKILFIAHDSKIEGGANRSLMTILDYFRYLDKYDITVMVPRENGEFVNYLKIEKYNYITSEYSWQLVGNTKSKYLLKEGKLLLLFWIDAIRAYKTAKRIRNYRFDLIYTNTRVIYVGNFLAFYLGIPHIMHCREFIDEVMHRRPVFFSENFLNRTTNCFVFISHAMSKVYHKLDYNKVKIVYNGISINSNLVTLSDREINRNNLKILLTGRLGEIKGQIDAINAINVLKNKYEVEAELFLAGSGGDSEYNSRIKKLINVLHLENNVHLLGEVKDMPSLRREMDVELVCSKFEAFGRVTIEAMASGLPVIGANAPATDEIISDGENGLLYEVGNADDLAMKVYKIISDSHLRKQLVINAQSDVQRRFSDKIMLNNVAAIVEMILKRY